MNETYSNDSPNAAHSDSLAVDAGVIIGYITGLLAFLSLVVAMIQLHHNGWRLPRWYRPPPPPANDPERLERPADGMAIGSKPVNISY